MQTIKTITIRLDAQEVDYVRMLQNQHKQQYGTNISQSDLFRMLLRKEAEKLQVDHDEIRMRDESLMQRIRAVQMQKRKSR